MVKVICRGWGEERINPTVLTSDRVWSCQAVFWSAFSGEDNGLLAGGVFDGGVVDEVLEILAGNKSSASRKHTFTLKYDICGSDFIFWDFLKMCSDCLHTSAAINVVATQKKKKKIRKGFRTWFMGELHLKIVTLNIRRVYYPDKLANEKKEKRISRSDDIVSTRGGK